MSSPRHPAIARRPAVSAAAWMVVAALVSACQPPPSAPSDIGPGATDNNGTPPTVQIPQVAGEYTLTMGGGICKWSPLPWDLMNRTYRASLAQQGSFLQLSFSGHNFEGLRPGTSPVVTGQLYPSTGVATFDLPKPHNGWWNEGEYEWAPVTELLSDGSRLEIEGTVQATLDPSGLSGTFTGIFRYSPASPGALSGRSCESDHHRFTLTR